MFKSGGPGTSRELQHPEYARSTTKSRGDKGMRRADGSTGPEGAGRAPDAAVVLTETVKDKGAPFVRETLAGTVQVATNGAPVEVNIDVPVNHAPAEAARLNCAAWPVETQTVVNPPTVGLILTMGAPVSLTYASLRTNVKVC